VSVLDADVETLHGSLQPAASRLKTDGRGAWQQRCGGFSVQWHQRQAAKTPPKRGRWWWNRAGAESPNRPDPRLAVGSVSYRRSGLSSEFRQMLRTRIIPDRLDL